MSQETFKIIQKLNPKMLETQIIMQCAPMLSGLKTSNLLIVQQENAEDVFKIFKKSAIQCVLLALNKKKATFLVYNPILLNKHLHSNEVLQLLRSMGHKDCSLKALINEISELYGEYQKSNCKFPHEIGLLLGYPADDVQAYIIHQGQNALLTGYWQVYFNPDEKKQIFQSYDFAREKLLSLLSKGIKLDDIIKNFHAAFGCATVH